MFKNIICFAVCLSQIISVYAQLHSSTPVTPVTAQPVPNATATEKSAPTPKPLITPAENPVPPVYPGGQPKVVVTQPQLISPASPPATTQQSQKEPLTPIESTNLLKPSRPQRQESSRKNRVVEIPVSPAQTGVSSKTNLPGVTRPRQVYVSSATNKNKLKSKKDAVKYNSRRQEGEKNKKSLRLK